jgi:hypothetical protein
MPDAHPIRNRHYRNLLTPRTSALIALGILSLLWALFFWRLLTPAPADRVIFAEGDFTQHFYAFWEYQVERLVGGEFPLWNPYNHAGDPFAGNIQLASFYPPRLLSAWLVGQPSIEAYQLEVAAHYWLASLLMFAFLRVIFARSGVALVGAVLYAYSGYLTGYPMLQPGVLFSAAWLPLMLLGAHLSVTRRGWTIRGCVLAGAGLALSFLGGHPQTTLHIAYLTIAYLAFKSYLHHLPLTGFLLRAALLGGIGAGLAAVQLFPALEFTRLSHRVAQESYIDKAHGFDPAHFFQVIWPGLFGDWSPLYVGLGALLLALGAMLRARLLHLFWMGVIVVGLFLSLGSGSIVYDVFYIAAPGFDLFRQQERIAALISFALVMLAVHQLDWLLDSRSRTERAGDERRFAWLIYGSAAALVIVYALAVLVELFRAETGQPQPSSVFGFVAMIAALLALWQYWQNRHPRPRRWIFLPLLALLIIDLFSLGTRSTNFLPDLPENRVRPPSTLEVYGDIPPDEIAWRVDGAAGLQGYSVYFRAPDIYGTGPISLDSIAELRHIPVDRFWEVLAVRYVTTTDEVPEDVPLELIAYEVNYSGEEVRVFELQDPRPLAHLVYDYRLAEDNPPFARQIMADPRVDLREMAVTLSPLPFELAGQRPEISRVQGFTMPAPERIELTVFTGDDALLTVAIPHYPGWRATVNGEPVPIIDTYAGLMGIPVRAGEDQSVQLVFAPDTVLWGGITTGVMLLAVGLLLAADTLRRRVSTRR